LGLSHFKGARKKRTRENQAGFGPRGGFADNIFALCLIIQQFERYNLPLMLVLLDFVSAFDSTLAKHFGKF